MMYFSRLKVAMILGACVLGLLLCLPNILPAPAGWVPWRQVRLGLDLRGGSYLLLEVDMAAVARERLDSLADGARTALRGKVTGFQPPQVQPDQGRVLIRISAGPQQNEAVRLLREAATIAGPAEFDVAATGNEVALSLAPAALRERANSAVLQSIEIVRRRIDETGVIDPIITRQGEARIVVQLPGIEDPNRIKELLGRTARMTFRLLDENANLAGTPPPGVDFLAVEGQPGVREAVRRRVEVDGASLTDARPGQDTQSARWVVNFTFDSVGARRFADVTNANVGRRFAIVLDDRVISAPVIQTPITGGRGQISGSFTARTAQDLAVLLRAGALPAPLTVVEERSVGPELGADSIRNGAIALAVGLLLVMAYMAIFYGLFGWFANVALLANLFLQIAVLSLLEATLTLPGMAGILLTLGVAVDANILINERIREEVQAGRTPLNALEAGFRRAYSTIIDSNATAFLAHVMLFAFGSGPVRGFAVTITVGIVTTLFTATLVARMMMVRWYVRTKPALLPV
ncbi:MAG: protein translocase subunit SecD [Gemmatimonadaceae bacterium]|nr:protein translocase subunit SecD [Acetobacteraceae bacterium]